MQNYIWYVVGAVALVAMGVYVAFASGVFPAPKSATTTPLPTTSMRELAASNVSQKCTFNSAANTGTMYVAGGKVRGDFSAHVGGNAIVGHMIMADNTSYVWMDGMSQGFKNSFEASAQATSSAQSQGVGPDERVSYSCEPWAADQSLFALPQNITFTAIGAAQVQSGAGAVGVSCSQCDLIPDATAKQQCRAALQC